MRKIIILLTMISHIQNFILTKKFMLNNIEKYNNFVLATVNCNLGKEISSILILFVTKK